MKKKSESKDTVYNICTKMEILFNEKNNILKHLSDYGRVLSVGDGIARINPQGGGSDGLSLGLFVLITLITFLYIKRKKKGGSEGDDLEEVITSNDHIQYLTVNPNVNPASNKFDPIYYMVKEILENTSIEVQQIASNLYNTALVSVSGEISFFIVKVTEYVLHYHKEIFNNFYINNKVLQEFQLFEYLGIITEYIGLYGLANCIMYTISNVSLYNNIINACLYLSVIELPNIFWC